MPRVRGAKPWLILLGGLALIAAVLALAFRSRPKALLLEPGPTAGLAWLPAEAGLVAGVDLDPIREQGWLIRLLEEASANGEPEREYRAFVGATGFDYTRDLRRAWLGLYGPGDVPHVVGVAEGRFARERILAFSRRQKAALTSHREFQIYTVPTDPHLPRGAPRAFSFAFLDPTHLAFGSDSARVRQVIDCWAQETPCVGSDSARRAEIERLAAGRHAWVVNELSRWTPAALERRRSSLPTLRLLAGGLQARADRLDLTAEAHCRDSTQAQRLRDSLRVLLLVGRLALARQPDKNSRALGEAFENLSLGLEGSTLQIKARLSPETLAALLSPPARAEGAR